MPASAATFGELLARAKAEAAAGQNWAPPGDNVTDTVMAMMELTPTATPEQLSELLALLHAHEALANPGQTAVASRDASIDPSGPMGREPNRAVLDQMLATQKPQAATSPVETHATDNSVALASPQSRPRIASRVMGDPSTVRIIRPDPHAATLSKRGHDAEQNGDISGARRFYAGAADLGDAVAALNIGRLYDPAFVERNTVGGIDADPAQARLWYERAAALGNTEARSLLEALSVR